MNNITPEVKLEVVHYYLRTGTSLRNTGLKFHIAYRTIFKWVKLYKERGEEQLLQVYRRPWNRTERVLEEKIALMKENNPSLTVRRAQEYLEQAGIRISIKGIWGIWKRYGYAGFERGKMSEDWTHCSWSKEATAQFKLAQQLLNLGAVEKSARILNSISALPENDVLRQIPDTLLNVRRRIEKTTSLFGDMPAHSYLEKMRVLYEECQRENMNYAVLVVGLSEIMALSWCGEPGEMLQKIENLKNVLRKTEYGHSYQLFPHRFALLLSEGYANAERLKIRKASEIARVCRKWLKKRKYVSPHFMRNLGQLYTGLQDLGEAEYWHLRSLQRLCGEEEKQGRYFLADVYFSKGEYAKVIRILKDKSLATWGRDYMLFCARSMLALINGKPHKAISLATAALSHARTEEILGLLPPVNLTIASAYCSLGETAKAESILRRTLPFLVKHELKHYEIVFKMLLHRQSKGEYPILSTENILPTVQLVDLLKNGQYTKALKRVRKMGTLNRFFRYIFFFPEVITGLLERGKPTGLPTAMVRLPAFRKEIPVYSLKFLGNMVIRKNQKPLYVKLTPKDTSFLIYLAVSKSRCIPLERVYRNFWPKSNRASRNLAHLLVRVRKAINLPPHLLYIKGNTLLFDGYFVTDYSEFTQHLAQAKALLRADQWEFGNDEYLKAFALFRAEPFKRMYDNWSEDMRHMLLDQLEGAALDFAKCCSVHGDVRTARKVLQKVSKIIPYSDEISQTLGTFSMN